MVASKKQHVLITGGSGFIGSNCAAQVAVTTSWGSPLEDDGLRRLWTWLRKAPAQSRSEAMV